MTRIFVTGGSSPLGERLVRHLVEDGLDVISLARSPQAAERITRAGGAVIRGIIEDVDGWSSQAASADHVVHLAGIAYAPQVLAAVPAGVPLVAVSSASANNPSHPEAEAIARREALIFENRPQAVVLRPTMIYGTDRERNVRHLSILLSRLPAVPALSGGGLLQPVYVDDVVGAITYHLGASGRACVELGGPDRLLLGDLVDRVSTELRLRRVKLRLPVGAVARLAHGGIESRHAVLHAMGMLHHDRVVPIPTKELLGRSPTTLEEGLPRALAEYGLSPRSPRRSSGVRLPR